MHTVVPVITRKDFSSGNPGDVFICLGMQWLFEQAFEQSIDWFYLNKFSAADFEKHKDLLGRAGFCIYAGTPQYNNYDDWCLWYDWPMWQEYIIPLGIDFYSIAGGSGFPNPEMTAQEFADHCLSSFKTRSILNSRSIRTKGVTVRDKHAHDLLNQAGTPNILLPCTAVWSSKYLNIKKKPSKYIALVPPNPDSIAPQVLGFKTKLQVEKWVADEWMKLLLSYEDHEHQAMLVCHGIREYELFRKHTDQIYFTNDGKALLQFYAECSLVIGARLHAVLPAFGIGEIKTVFIQIDTRGSAIEHFDNIPIVSISRWSVSAVREAAARSKCSSAREVNAYRDQYKELFLDWFGDLI